ncbi:class D sortase [Romboutsia ilealis]|uniref:Class D sortase n=1 Tax=Romboutsia faecis TaxID=2764597 RepID=A0ABR7JKV1_9FIRM|nr:class D sortase [Romboutsia faecis]MBC5995553.1 class D sortase [Romboutsia faecis]MRN23753.1 class D sortase [Romboutsia ilealis]
MKRISKILFTLGLILILGSVSLNMYTKYKQNQAKNKFTQKIENREEIKDINLGDEIGLIDIPSLNISTAIVSGTGKDQIKYYVGHFENTPMPGDNGNFCIAGHSSTIYNNIFNDLHKIKIDDEIIITTSNGEFIYVVNDIFETEPTNMGVLSQDNDLKELTIVTCSNQGKDRLIVKARLK